MTNLNFDLPKGIHQIYSLPNNDLDSLWNSIVLNDALKKQLISQAIINFTLRPKISRSILPLHGITLLVGPPGTGKTSLAKGLAHKVAEVFDRKDFKLLEVDPHTLTSAMMGKTQKAVSDLFSQTISEAASNGPTIVLLDEVETLAADRSKLSLEANPIDIHRATDAVLVQLDALAEKHKNILIIATSNFPQAIDQAFTSRCDLVLEIPLPNEAACREILMLCLNGLGESFDSINHLISDKKIDQVISELVGMDGRLIRKIVATAFTLRSEVAVNPSLLSIDDLLKAAKQAKANRIKDNN